MTSIILNLISAAIGTLAAFAWRAVRDRIPLYKLSPSRRKILRGKWTGVAKPIVPATGIPAEIPVEYEFDIGLFGRRITAVSHYLSLEDSERIADEHKGGFYQARFLMLSFCKQHRHVNGFGTIILELDDKAKHLTGYALGYGSEVHGLYLCEVLLKPVTTTLTPIKVA